LAAVGFATATASKAGLILPAFSDALRCTGGYTDLDIKTVLGLDADSAITLGELLDDCTRRFLAMHQVPNTYEPRVNWVHRLRR
jgi:hypothetical protein